MQLTYAVPDEPKSVKPYDGSLKYAPAKLLDLLTPGQVPDIVFGAQALEKNKAIAKLVMHAIAMQSFIDSQFSILLAEITKANAEIVAAMINAIVSAQLKKSVISDAARSANLSENEKNVFLSLFSLAENTSKVRNHFSHHLWGSVSGFEDYLLLLHPKHYSSANAVIQQKHARGGTLTDEDADKRRDFLFSKSAMYSKGHLDGLIEEQNYIYGKLKELEILFQTPPLRQIAFGALIYEPRILKVLQSRKKPHARRNKPKAQS
jgi:hypothetical protein